MGRRALCVAYAGAVDQLVLAAFTTRGLEDVAAAELAETLGHARDLEIRTKLVLFRSADVRRLRGLRTVDDIAVMGAHGPSVQTQHDLIALATEQADLAGVVDVAGRAGSMDGEFSVTVSAAHVDYGSGAELEQAVGAAIASRYGWRHVTLRRAAVDVRLFVDGPWAAVGVRLFNEPLSRRAYRRVNVRGALRPTVAAAMVRMASPNGGRPGVWDPFCGSGTILCEAAERGHEVWGTDNDDEAVEAARENVSTVRRDYWNRIERADSTVLKTWQRHRSATAVVSNLPWGKQVAIRSKQALYVSVGGGVCEVAGRGGCGVLLTTEPQAVLRRVRRDDGLEVDERKIGLLGQTPTIVTVRPRR